MESLIQKYEKLNDAVSTLKEAIDSFDSFESIFLQKLTPEDHNKYYKVFRDSLIQRFEYTTDMFWKYLKIYLETKSFPATIISPATAIQAACTSGLINEHEGHQLLSMVKGRNKTSHIYVEEIAEQLSEKIPSYCQVMSSILLRLLPT